MTATTPPERLRDGGGNTGDPAARAGAIVRAVSDVRPPALSPEAQARVLAALRSSSGQRRTGLRFVLQAGVAAAVVVTAFGAAAALSWYREAHRPPLPVTAPPPPPAVRPTERRAPPALPPVQQPLRPRKKLVEAPEPVGPPPEVEKPRLAINPQDPRYRIALPQDLLRAGAVIPALVEVCVSAAGDVTGAKVMKSPARRLDAALLKMVRTWKFTPARRDGIPVPSCTTVSYELSVAGEAR
jgi:TonB family protein